MQTNEVEQQIETPKVKTLKVRPIIKPAGNYYKYIPEIRLCGEWLEKLGFIPEQKVTVIMMEKELVIRLVE